MVFPPSPDPKIRPDKTTKDKNRTEEESKGRRKAREQTFFFNGKNGHLNDQQGRVR
jgi:hypothetical protein